eukprot:gene9642-6898_t
MPTHKKGQDRDKYYQLAKDQGFRSRAAFKLIQINKRYGFLSKAKVCIDLCAAPGGWCQVAAKAMLPGSLVIGVDLLPIRPIRGVKTIVGDITTAKCRQDIIVELQGWKADAVLCDGAPNIGSAYSKDAFVQNELVLAALKTASDHLVKGGVFCTKIYRSVDYNALIWVLQQLFEDVQTMKPSSSRSQSSEIFLICIGFIAPKTIDAKLFDPNFVFKEIEDPGTKRPDVLHKKYEDSYKRQRSGYDDKLGMTLRATIKVADFIHSKDPVRVLTDMTEVVFEDDADKLYLEHPRTIEEVKIALSDLKVLGKIDFKKLLKWRQLMRDTYHPAPEKPAEEKKQETDDELDPEEKIMQEIDDMRYKAAVEDRKVEKKSRKAMRKERMRQQLGMHHNAFDVSDDQELFGLDPNLTADDIDRLAEILDHDLEDELEDDYRRTLLQKRSKKAQTIGADALEEREFKSDRTHSNKEHARKSSAESKLRAKEQEDEELLDEVMDEDDSEEGDDDSDASDEDDEDVSEAESEASERPEKDGRRSVKFMVSKSDDAGVTGKAGKWFANPLFSTSQSVLSSVSTALQQSEKEASKSSNKRKRDAAEDDEDDDAKWDNYMPKTDKELRKEKRRKVLERKERKLQRQMKKAGSLEDDEDDEHRILGNGMDDEGFRIVPNETIKSKATGIAAADDRDTGFEKALVDASYNRFAFNDASGLPSWFLDDEMRHNKPQIPVPPALLDQIKNKYQMTGTNGKVIKKVAEARMRKKKRVLMQLKKAKKQASLLAENNELSERQKVKLLAKAMRGKNKDSTEKDRKIYVSTKKTQAGSMGSMAKGGAKGGKLKFVDKRMKKDKRMQRAADKRKKR